MSKTKIFLKPCPEFVVSEVITDLDWKEEERKNLQEVSEWWDGEGTTEKLFKCHFPVYLCFAKFLLDVRLGIIVFAKSQTKLVFLKKQVPGGWQLEINWIWYLDVWSLT